MEVRSAKLAKSAWRGKADLVINRLKNVCSLWSLILANKEFLSEVHRLLDSIG